MILYRARDNANPTDARRGIVRGPPLRRGAQPK
jgi:hypothetical protein